MKQLKHLPLVWIFLTGILGSCNRSQVTFESLLTELTDRTQITYIPQPLYTVKQFSSYDRRSTAPDREGWFANRDYTHFIREENTEGRREFVLFDARGPGAVVRFWMTFAGEGAMDGILRIYIDGMSEPVVADSVGHVISGGLLAGEPLSTSVSPLTEYERRGHNLYLPIPYSGHCKITYECDAIEITETTRKPSVYYNINYRTYEPGTIVTSLSMTDIHNARQLITEANNNLVKADVGLIKEETEIKQTIPPGDTVSTRFSGGALAIQKITMRLRSDDMSQALRSTVLNMNFDGQQTVWVPVGEFFGTGYQIHPSKTWYSEVTEGGILIARWLMPFREHTEIRFINFGNQDVEVDCIIGFASYRWKSSSMYFGSSWHEYFRIHSADLEERNTDEWHFDVNYIDIKGKGVYAGDALTVFNTADAWWGEGDEKIFVDGEDFPSCIGTGTEDYYGYAWCRPEEFSHPFIAQPTGAGNFYTGMTVNMRYRVLDAMPFQKEIHSNIELWHWALTRINMAMTTYYYGIPGFTININPDPEAVRRTVARSRADLYEPRVNDSGILEGEWMQAMNRDGGTVGIQSAAWYDWSESSQLWWHHGDVGHELELKFLVNEPDEYHLQASFTQAVDYGIIQLFVNGQKAGLPFNGYINEGVKTRMHDLGNHALKAGENTMTIRIIGKDPRAKPGYMAGIDFVRFGPIE